MEDNGELPVPFSDFLVRCCLWKVEDRAVLERERWHCGAMGGKDVFTRDIPGRQRVILGARDGPDMCHQKNTERPGSQGSGPIHPKRGA